MVVKIKKYGEVILAKQFESLYNKAERVILLSNKDLTKFDKIARILKNDSLIVIDNIKKRDLLLIVDYLKNHSKEILNIKDFSKKISGKQRDYQKRNLDKNIKDLTNRLLLISENDSVVSIIDKQQKISYLSLLTGLDTYPLIGKFLIPVTYYLELISKGNRNTRVDFFQKDFYTPKNVLPPKSTATIEMFKESYDFIKNEKNDVLDVLDMGCGSGVLTLLLKNNFPISNIYFTDILSEAIGATLRNLESNLGNINDFRAFEAGSLFSKIPKLNQFDLINFNLPWIDAPARNRQELALNDFNQELANDFFKEANNYLKDKGVIVAGYSDNSGEKSVIGLENIIDKYGLKIVKEISKKIQSYQSGRKWMKIFCLILIRK